MNKFLSNNCRICPKVFCCEKCRITHETAVHKIFPDCDICAYGTLYLENIDDCFLQHLKVSHLPVHCIYCKKIFGSIEELLQHKKCTYFHSKELSPKTPFRTTPAVLISTDDQDSPILLEIQRQEHLNYILATSTPMQRGEEQNMMFEKSKEVITPVDKNSINKSIIKKTDSGKSEEQSSKRRVTFGETSVNPPEKRTETVTPDNHVFQSKKDVVGTLEDGTNEDRNYNENSTPGTGMNSEKFYSAKTESVQFYSAKTDVFSKPLREENKIKCLEEGFTPVAIPTMSKLFNIKGDIYKKQDQEFSDSPDPKNCSKIENKSMEICSPAKTSDIIEINHSHNWEKNNAAVEFLEGKIAVSPDNVAVFCTPAKAASPEKNADIDIHKESEKISSSKNTEEHEKISEDVDDPNKILKLDSTGHDTLWLSATSLEELNIQSNENEHPEEIDQATEKDSSENSPAVNNQRRVSIVIPTPILKTTNVQMKIHFPTHLASTPILSGAPVKIKQTKIVEDFSTQVTSKLKFQTPYKTPEGRLCEILQKKIVQSNLRKKLAALPSNQPESSSENKQMVPLHDNHSSSESIQCKDTIQGTISEPFGGSYSCIDRDSDYSVSASSMTESSLWSSMTRIVKGVFGGLSTISQNSSNASLLNTSNTYKRQLSDSETGDFLEAPRLKRFKFTDIKGRRAIRDLTPLDLRCSLPDRAAPLARIEIMKSVSTVYGQGAIRIRCDKATQTDDYLMYGWHPQV